MAGRLSPAGVILSEAKDLRIGRDAFEVEKGRHRRPFNPFRVFGFDPREINKLQFEVNGKQYFLAFVEDERRWYVFSPTPQGMHRIPVYVDGAAGASESVSGKVSDVWN